jgi:hypothetical protein
MTKEIKYIIWNVNWLDNLISNTYHCIFEVPEKQLPVEIGEPLALLVHDPLDDSLMEIGLGIVTSLKTCQIYDLEKQDYSRQKGNFRSQDGTIHQLARVHKRDFDLSSVIRVLTLRRNDHDLASLNRYVKNSRQVIQSEKTKKETG